MISSFVMSLIVPKILGVEEYAYWQLFLLYSSYTGLALLGVNDGLYLRLGGKRYDDLDDSELHAQILAITVFQLVIGLACVVAIQFLEADINRRLVFSLVVAFGFIANITSCLRYIFQSTNLTQISSIADMSSKISFLVCVVATLVTGEITAWLLIVLYIACQLLALIYIMICAQRIIGSKPNWNHIFSDCTDDIVAGIKITISYYADSLIVGITRMMTDWKLGLAVFGKLSLAFSLTNFVLGFIGQVSMVLFPMLKRLDSEGQRQKYLQIRSILHVVLPMVYLFYVPVRVILNWWLPQYEESLIYLALTMPLVIYSCKANFLFDTYLKMGRHEGVLGVVNVTTMAINAGLSAVAIFAFGSVEWAAVGIVISVVIRDYIFERYEAREQNAPFMCSVISELTVSIAFMVMSWNMGLWSWPAVIAALLAYLSFNHTEARYVAEVFKTRLAK